MNEPIFNLNRPYTIAIRQQWLPPDVTNCMVFNFNVTKLWKRYITQGYPKPHNLEIPEIDRGKSFGERQCV